MKTAGRLLAVGIFALILSCPGLGFTIGFLDLQDLNLITEGTLANQLMGARATITNVVFTGNRIAAGTFQNGLVDGIGIGQGIILTTGDIFNAVGPNNDPSFGLDNFEAGDAALDLIVGTPPGTFDSTVLEFDFNTTARVVTFKFVFASDEYNEVTAPTIFGNDVFALYVDGVNVALTLGTGNPITVGNINLNSNSSLFINNDPNFFFPLNPPFLTQYDGFTKVLSITVAVTPNVTHHIKLAIADEFDGIVDSAAFLAPAVFAVPDNLVDFDKDGKKDIAFYRGSTGEWFVIPSSSGIPFARGLGGPGSTPVPGDYDGDGKTDVAVYDTTSGVWSIIPSSGAPAYGVGWGGTGFKPVPGDYDGDGKNDIAIYDTTGGAWWVIPSSGAPAYGIGWGGSGFSPVPGDYDGDGKTDIAIYDTASGAWWIVPSSGAPAYGVGWGGPGFKPVPGDYDGDGKTDIAIYQSSIGAWWVIPSSGAPAYGIGWGGTGFTPVPGDYDVDGKTDIAIYDTTTGAWWIVPSSGAPAYGVGWGGDTSDIPLTSVLPGIL